MQLLKDKVAVVTGGTAGIGKEIALNYAKQGASVVIVGTNAERAALVVQEMEAVRKFPEQRFESELADISDKKAVDQILSAEAVLVDVQPARKVIPGFKDNLITHAGPPISWERMVKVQKSAWRF